jgi:hypothetical protein
MLDLHGVLERQCATDALRFRRDLQWSNSSVYLSTQGIPGSELVNWRDGAMRWRFVALIFFSIVSLLFWAAVIEYVVRTWPPYVPG